MKKLFLLFLIVTSASYSQIGSDVTNVNIILSEVRQIEVIDASVDIVVNTANHYINGNTSNKPNHIKITSTTDYQVTAKVSGDFTNGAETIPFNKVSILASAGLGANSTAIFSSTTPLNTTPFQIISTDGGDIERYVNVLYTLEGGEHLLNIPVGTYTALVTYELIPN